MEIVKSKQRCTMDKVRFINCRVATIINFKFIKNYNN